MYNDDDYNNNNDGLFGGLFGLGILLIILYIMARVWTAIASVAAIAGVGVGGFNAIKNYFASLKENLIDSNFSEKM